MPEKKISEQRYEASEKMNNDFFLAFTNDVENQPYYTILGSLYYPLKMLDILEGAGGRLRYFFPYKAVCGFVCKCGGCGGQGE